MQKKKSTKHHTGDLTDPCGKSLRVGSLPSAFAGIQDSARMSGVSRWELQRLCEHVLASCQRSWPQEAFSALFMDAAYVPMSCQAKCVTRRHPVSRLATSSLSSLQTEQALASRRCYFEVTTTGRTIRQMQQLLSAI